MKYNFIEETHKYCYLCNYWIPLTAWDSHQQDHAYPQLVEVRDFFDEARDELVRARSKHPGKQASLHEGYAVLLEEVDELWDEVKKKTEDRDFKEVRAELLQIAAMAARMAEDLL